MWTLSLGDGDHPGRMRLLNSRFTRRNAKGEYNGIREAWAYSTFHRYTARGAYPLDWVGDHAGSGAFGECLPDPFHFFRAPRGFSGP